MACAKRLPHEPAHVTVIDRENYHLFQPLLYQVATAALSPADITTPVRAAFRDNARMRVLRGTVTAVDTAARQVIADGRAIAYDMLVLATGATHGYFGHEEWAVFAPGLKSVADATSIRSRILDAFEEAEATEGAVLQRKLLTFLICGAGPTGVEMAGAIAELAHNGMAKDFRNFDPASARILLVQAGPRVLPQFDERLSAFARSSLEALGVEVHTDSRVELIDGDGVVVNGERIEAGTVLWAAGVVASPASSWLGAGADPAGRIKVAPDLLGSGSPRYLCDRRYRAFPRLGWPNCSRARARREAGRCLRCLGFAGPAARPPTAATLPLSPPGQPGHDRPEKRCCRFWAGEGHRRSSMVALGCRAHSFPGRRTQSAFGHARLGMVLFYVRRRRTADHGNRSGSTFTYVLEPSLTKKVSGLGIGVSKEQY